MAEFILIVFFKYSAAGGSTSAVFATEQACRSAAAKIEYDIKKTWDTWGGALVFTACIPKSLNNP